MPDTLPVHQTEVHGFWMDETTVTNAQFARFVAEKAYVTVAEKTPKQEDYPDAPKGTLFAGSAVFNPPANVKSLSNPYAWWKYVAGAYWRHPEGPGSEIEKRMDHPAVHVAYEDAETFCRLNGKRLPTEAEYEFAARGGLSLESICLGKRAQTGWKVGGEYLAGQVPDKNPAEGRIFENVSSEGVSAEWFRSLRYGWKCLAVDFGLVSTGHLCDPRRKRRAGEKPSRAIG